VLDFIIMENQKYSYPDKDDGITVDLIIKNSEPYHGYWGLSEAKALSFFYKTIKKQTHDSLLDLAAGKGRLTIEFAPYFKKVVALEPDHERIKEAKKNCHNAGIDNIHFVESLFLGADLKDSSFNVVVCSHLIQHIPAIFIGQTFKKIFNILKPGGILLLTTSYTKEDQNRFEKHSRIIEHIDEETFNDLIINNRENILPVQYFSMKYLKNLLVDFQIIKIWHFHDESKRFWPDRVIFRDTLLNFLGIDFGRDVLMLMKKPLL